MAVEAQILEGDSLDGVNVGGDVYLISNPNRLRPRRRPPQSAGRDFA